jgi:hypothetical protein
MIASGAAVRLPGELIECASVAANSSTVLPGPSLSLVSGCFGGLKVDQTGSLHCSNCESVVCTMIGSVPTA